jgi:hypothetical protein
MDDAVFWGTRMTRMTRIFFVLFLNYSAERVLRDLRFFCENLREKNMDDAVFFCFGFELLSRTCSARSAVLLRKSAGKHTYH